MNNIRSCSHLGKPSPKSFHLQHPHLKPGRMQTTKNMKSRLIMSGTNQTDHRIPFFHQNIVTPLQNDPKQIWITTSGKYDNNLKQLNPKQFNEPKKKIEQSIGHAESNRSFSLSCTNWVKNQKLKVRNNFLRLNKSRPCFSQQRMTLRRRGRQRSNLMKLLFCQRVGPNIKMLERRQCFKALKMLRRQHEPV